MYARGLWPLSRISRAGELAGDSMPSARLPSRQEIGSPYLMMTGRVNHQRWSLDENGIARRQRLMNMSRLRRADERRLASIFGIGQSTNRSATYESVRFARHY